MVSSINIDNSLNSPGVLPYTPQGKRILANDLIRSSLFTASNHNLPRDFLKDKSVYCYGNTEILYRGEELRQDDSDVFMLLIYGLSHFEKVITEDCSIEFMPYTFIKQLGWPQRPHYKDKLKDCLSRLNATALSITNTQIKEGLSVSLVRKFSFQDDEGDQLKYWKVWLEKEISQIFKKNCYSKISWDQRVQLGPLAKWLHAFYSSHAEPYALNVDTLYSLCGSKAKSIKHFKSDLKRNLSDLVQIGFLKDFYFVGNKVQVLRDGKEVNDYEK